MVVQFPNLSTDCICHTCIRRAAAMEKDSQSENQETFERSGGARAHSQRTATGGDTALRPRAQAVLNKTYAPSGYKKTEQNRPKAVSVIKSRIPKAKLLSK